MVTLAHTVIAVLLLLLKKVLIETAKLAWADIWQAIFNAVVKAEDDAKAGKITDKRSQVVGEVISWVETHAKLNFLEIWALKYLVGLVADSIVKTINDSLSHDWLAAAKAEKAKLESEFPFLAPATGTTGT